MIEVTRGSMVHFYDWQFRDVDREPTVPESACLRIRYQKHGCRAVDEIEMQNDGGLWSAQWDSSQADPGTIYYHIRSLVPEGFGADGEFRLKANPANGNCDCDN